MLQQGKAERCITAKCPHKSATLARQGPAVWLLSWHYSPSETKTEKSFIERNTKKYVSLRENLSLLSRDSCVGLGVPPVHTSTVFQAQGGAAGGTIPQHPEPAAGAALAQLRNRVRVQSKVLAWCLPKICFKGLQFFTPQSSQPGSNPKRCLCKLFLPAVWRNWDQHGTG